MLSVNGVLDGLQHKLVVQHQANAPEPLADGFNDPTSSSIATCNSIYIMFI